MAAGNFKQTYKNRAEAFREFILPQKLPVSQSSFFIHCGEHGMVNPDKTVHLATLLGYVRDVLKVDPGTGQSLAESNRAKETEELEYRKLLAETEKRERENEDAARELDQKWLHRDSAEERLAGLIGALEDALDHHIYAGAVELIHKAGGDPARLEEVIEHQKDQKDLALGEVLQEEKIEAVLRNSEEDDE